MEANLQEVECWQLLVEATAVLEPGDSVAVCSGLMVASSATVAAAGKKPAEMTESLLAGFEFVVTASELTEKGTAGEAEVVAAEQVQAIAVDLLLQTWSGGLVVLQLMRCPAGSQFEKQVTVFQSQSYAVMAVLD